MEIDWILIEAYCKKFHFGLSLDFTVQPLTAFLYDLDTHTVQYVVTGEALSQFFEAILDQLAVHGETEYDDDDNSM